MDYIYLLYNCALSYRKKKARGGDKEKAAVKQSEEIIS